MKIMTLFGLLLTLRLAAIGTCAGDVITTHAVLQSGGYEANPILGGNTLLKTAAIDGGTLAMVTRLEKKQPKLAAVLYLALMASRGFATAHNAREMR